MREVDGAEQAASEGEARAERSHGELFVGIDLGATNCLGVAVSAVGDVVDEVVTPTRRGAEAIFASVGETVDLLAAGRSVAAVGVGVPGIVDRKGVLRIAPNMPEVVDFDVVACLEQRLHMPVQVDNDATCAAWGEYHLGAARGVDDAIVVTLGTGIGGGMIVDGQLYRGGNGFAGEIGHVLMDPAGPLCGCGRSGCWETLASGTALGRMARGAALEGQARRIVELAGGYPEDVTGEHVTLAAREGDVQAMGIMRQLAWWVAAGLVNLANIFDPDVFVLTGGLVDAGDVLLAPTEEAFRSLFPADGRPSPRFVVAELGSKAGAIGAACLSW